MSEELTPAQIVEELNKFVVGQANAKKAVAIALRNRWRRKNVFGDIKDEIVPHNILMVGPTGVGKTEIARRLAKLVKAPFIKIEATKFTEVGYVGRDVDSIIRDLLEISIKMLRTEKRKEVESVAVESAENRIIHALVGESASEETKAKFLMKLRGKVIDDKEIEISIAETQNLNMPSFDIPGGQIGAFNITDLLGKTMGGGKHKNVKMKVAAAYQHVLKEEMDKLLDDDSLVTEAIQRVEQDGIVFLDEVDKISSDGRGRGEVSREGVQRDLLPLIEGTVVSTKYGHVKTDHILFIASGAFHLSKPSDLLPELQGRLPVRVELSPLSKEDMILILTSTQHSLTKQYSALFAVENVDLEFTDSGISAIASIATEINKEVENIGARRLHTIMEKLLEQLNFEASNPDIKKVTVDEDYVNSQLVQLTKSNDLSKFIL
jgi:ATP-dependent HslUV protease ATP-binding subunit HslU